MPTKTDPELPRLTDSVFDAKLDALCQSRRARILRGTHPGPNDYLIAAELAVCATPEQSIRMRARLEEEEVTCPDPKRRGRA